MATIAAYSTKFDISAKVNFFDRRLRIVGRTFCLRNLSGDTLDSQVEEAKAILADVAGELRYLTGVGVDKVTLASRAREVSQLAVGLEPCDELDSFRFAVRFRMTTPCTYVWKHETGKTRWRLYEEDITDEWQRTLFCRRDKTVTFNLPCYPGDHVRQAMKTDRPFFLFVDWLKRRRSITGWTMYYDRSDDVFLRFMSRFGEDGNLAMGEKQYFRMEGAPMEVVGTFISPAKGRR